MKSLILVGGPSRSGTCSTTSYLHLSNDTFMYGSGGPINNLPNMPPETWYERKNFIPSIVSARYVQPEFTQFIIHAQSKNKLNLDFNYIGLRYDYVEKWKDIIFHLSQQYDTVRLVYCMRRDIEKLHISQRHNPYQREIDVFGDRISVSYGNAIILKQDKELASMGFDICAVDITVGGDDFSRLNSFLGLEPSDLQVKWQEFNVQTNQRDPKKMKEVLKIEYDRDLLAKTVKRLEPQYNEAKRILNG